MIETKLDEQQEHEKWKQKVSVKKWLKLNKEIEKLLSGLDKRKNFSEMVECFKNNSRSLTRIDYLLLGWIVKK